MVEKIKCNYIYCSTFKPPMKCPASKHDEQIKEPTLSEAIKNYFAALWEYLTWKKK